MTKQSKTSWESSAKWYDEKVGDKGHYYHEKVLLPQLLKIMELEKFPKPEILDLACGQGVLSRYLSKKIEYVGIDLSKSLIHAAKKRSKSPHHQFFVSDIEKKLPFHKQTFTHCVIILALQNIENPLSVLKNAASYLKHQGKLFIVLNHPCFRIPRQSQWDIDEKKKLQFRRLDCYLSAKKIPIQTHPSKGKQIQTFSFHHPLSDYSKWLREAGFSILQIEEWISDKTSSGSKSRMENRARKEFPLFLTFVCQKS